MIRRALLFLLGVASSSAASAQSLADVARREETRRAGIQQKAPVFTNADVERRPSVRGILPSSRPAEEPPPARLTASSEGSPGSQRATATARARRPRAPRAPHAAAPIALASTPQAQQPPPAVSPSGDPAPTGAHPVDLRAPRLVQRLPAAIQQLATELGEALESAPAQDERAIFDFLLNDVSKGEALVLLRGRDVWMRVKTLEDAGLTRLAGRREPIDGEAYVALGSLAPAVTYTLDEQEFTLRVRADSKLFPSNRRNLSVGAPSDLKFSQNASAFVNYGANWRGVGIYDLSLETGLSVKGALVNGTFSRSNFHPFLRGLTSVTFDDRHRMTRWIIGDTFVPGALGGGLVLGGIGVSREFGIDPYFIRYPTLGLAGSLGTPSVVDVYVNNHLIRRESLPPGEFELKNLPVPTGRGVTRMVIRDAFGRERQVVSPYFITTSVLAPGLHEYRYHAGFGRRQTGTANWAYGAPAVFGRHRVGVNPWITAGGQLEAALDLVNGGPLVTIRLPAGEMELTGAFSHDGSRGGSAASAAYSYQQRALSFGGFARGSSEGFRAVGSGPLDDHVRLEVNGFAGFHVGRLATFSVRHGLLDSTRQGREGRTSLSGSFRIWPRTDLFLTTTRIAGDEKKTMELFAGLTIGLGPGTVGSVSLRRDADARSAGVEIYKALPRDLGYGYRFRMLDAAQRLAGGALQYQGTYGRYEVAHQLVDDRQTTALSAAGGVVFIGGGLFASRPIQDAFAVVRVPGVRGVRAFASNQEVGRTNGRGEILIPNLQSYDGNRLGIADTDVPLEYSLGNTETTVALPYRGGAMVVFPVRPMKTARGTLVIVSSAGRTIPRYGQLIVTLGDKSTESPIGAEGEFYLEHVAPGRLPAVIEHDGGVCPFVLLIPESKEPLLDLGTVQCEAPIRAGGQP